MIIHVAQVEGAEQDVEQANNQSDQNEVCNTEYTMYSQYFDKYLDGMSIHNV